MSNYGGRFDNAMEVLLETARRAAVNSGCTHPEDLASAMIMAIEGAAAALSIQYELESKGQFRVDRLPPV